MDQLLAKSGSQRSGTSLRKWKSADELKELLIDYAPNKQYVFCRDKELCYFGTSPTLAVLNNEYDQIAAQAWLIPQLTDVADFSNCRNILNTSQIRACADMIATEYYYLKVSELMLFFYKFKNGEYGQFYGSVSPMVIMASLRQFIRERNDIIFQHESKERERREAEHRKGAMTAAEYFGPKAKIIIQYFDTLADVINSFISLTNKKVQQ